MPELPIISGRVCIMALSKLGYVVIRQRGSHVRLTCKGRPSITVPMHSTLDRGTLRSILRTVEISVDEFCALL